MFILWIQRNFKEFQMSITWSLRRWQESAKHLIQNSPESFSVSFNWPGIWPSFLSGLASEMWSCPWSPLELCYREAVPKFTLSSLWLADLASWLDLGSALLQGLEWQPQVLWPPLFTVLAPCFSFNLGTADLCPCQWVTASAVLVMLGPGSSSLAEQPDLAAKWHVGRKLPTRTN